VILTSCAANRQTGHRQRSRTESTVRIITGHAGGAVVPVLDRGDRLIDRIASVSWQDGRVTPPPAVSRYLARLVGELRFVLGDRLTGVYGLGALALGDFRPGHSDIDVYAVVDEPLDDELKRSVAAACGHRHLPCPARKLEMVLVSAEVAAAPGPAPDWELNLNTGEGQCEHVGLDASAEPRHWFVVDLALARQCGLTLFGPAPREVIAVPDPADVHATQADVVAWYARHGHESEVAAAACRAWHWHATGMFAPKRRAIRWAVRQIDR
jgi:hypothetical protein